MTVRFIVIWISIIALALCCVTLAIAHPCDSYTAEPLPYNYGRPDSTYPPEWNYNDITFVQYTDLAQMTHEEAYMVGGCLDPTDPDHKVGLRTWHCLVMDYVRAYYDRFGSIPDQLTPEVCAAAMDIDVTELPADDMEQLVSPVNGRYPMLNASTFSPGDVFIHVLTDQEMEYFASIDDRYNQIWFEGEEYSPVEKKTRQVWFQPPPYYIRVYGYSGVIHNAITFEYVRETK